ncbi:MAG: hypothetical protein FRX49_10455 [Trebouxia sp. A1-2]|nr:MAG: hypothetical protein FRX49_10455 [Trebouxia sp. A1-2]
MVSIVAAESDLRFNDSFDQQQVHILLHLHDVGSILLAVNDARPTIWRQNYRSLDGQHPVQVVEGQLLGQQQNTAWRVFRSSAKDTMVVKRWEPISIH